MDRTAAYLEIGKEKAREAGVDVVFEQADVRDFRRVAEFDAAISLFTSFGYFEDPRDDQKRFSIRLYSGIELKAMMLSAGFLHVDIYGTLDGDPYNQNARRLVAVGVE